MSAMALRPLKTISRQRKDIILSENLELMKRNILIFTQCNNMNSKEMEELRASLSKSKIQMKYLKTSVFKYALQSSFPQYSELLNVLGGPVVALSTDQEPGEAGSALISAIKGKKNMHFLAGKIEDKIWTHEGCSDVLQNLGKKHEIQFKLLSLLQAPAISLHSSLSQVPSYLTSLIHQVGKVEVEKSKDKLSDKVQDISV